ncbi:NUDIX domain-containing protein [Shinella sp. S4-D37]|uniref:NUDIX domain-containing protein n=1 Tax=Shinella sp. S4-D37 TaxID=3161999 RepID=UPI003465B113
MPARSAGLLIYRWTADELEVLLVHPGGPFWARKDDAAWSIPKGLLDDGEDEFAAALREAKEELGIYVQGNFCRLGEFRQPSGKTIVVWSVNADPSFDISNIQSNHFELEWPPRSGCRQYYPEVDRAAWLKLPVAKVKMQHGQRPMLLALEKQLATVTR